MMYDSDDEVHGVVSILTAVEIMEIGLHLLHFSSCRIQRAEESTNIDRFVSHFGAPPPVCADIWEDLQKTEVDDDRISPQDLSIKYFLMAMHHLKQYPTEAEREPIFDISHKW